MMALYVLVQMPAHCIGVTSLIGSSIDMATKAKRLPTSATNVPSPATGLVQTPDKQTEPLAPEAMLKAAMGFRDVTVDIPANATLGDVEKTLALAISGYQRLVEASERLKPIIGRILLTVQERKLYRPDYKNITEFIMLKVVGQMGFGRSNAFESLKIARAFPHLTAIDYQRYGASRLLLASRVTDETDPEFRTLLDKSTQTTVDAFESEVKQIHGEQVKTNKPPSTTLTMRVLPEVKEQWNAMIEASGLTPNDLMQACMDAMRALPQAHAATAEANVAAGKTPTGMPVNVRRRA